MDNVDEFWKNKKTMERKKKSSKPKTIKGKIWEFEKETNKVKKESRRRQTDRQTDRQTEKVKHRDNLLWIVVYILEERKEEKSKPLFSKISRPDRSIYKK